MHYDPILHSYCRFAVVIEYEDDVIFSKLPTPELPEIFFEIPRIFDLTIISLNLASSGSFGITWQYTEQLDYLNHFVGRSGVRTRQVVYGRLCAMNSKDVKI